MRGLSFEKTVVDEQTEPIESSPIEKPPFGSRTFFGRVDPSYSKRNRRRGARPGRRTGIPKTFRPPARIPSCLKCEKTAEHARLKLAGLGAGDEPVELTPEKIRERLLEEASIGVILNAAPAYGPKVRVWDETGDAFWICPRHDSLANDKDGKPVPALWSLPNRAARRNHRV